MKTPEEQMTPAEKYALEEWTDGDGGYSPYEIAKMSFDAGLAQAKSIWKKPDERPGVNSESVICARSDIGLVEFLASDNDHITQMMQTAYAWCYASDLLKTLPSFGTEEK